MSVASSTVAASRGAKLAYMLHRIAVHVCWVIPLLALLVGLHQVRDCWDDGAITAAFARTFAQTGKIALTPTSEQVEGFSSPSWMLILTAGDKVVHSVGGMLGWSKIASAGCFAASLFLFGRICSRVLDGFFVPFAIILLAFIVTPFTEVINGMEMNLYMLLILALADTLFMLETPSFARVCWAVLLSWAAIATRFEAPFLLLFLYLGFLVEFRKIKMVAWLVAADAVFLAATEFWRRKMFGVWLPNTILAKRWAPYSPEGMREILAVRYYAIEEIFTVLYIPIVFLCIVWIVSKLWSGSQDGYLRRKRISRLSAIVTVGAVLFDLGLGKDWGHPGRTVLAFMPFIILLLVSGFRAIVPDKEALREVVIFVIVFCQMGAWVSLANQASHENTASIAKVERIGLGLDQIRKLLHKETLSAFIPDIGGSALCCEKVTIFDSALLANHTLAEKGFQGTTAFLDANRPDVIETHWPWAQAAGLYSNHYLDGYGLVGANGAFLYVRKDLYLQLMASGYHEVPTYDGFQICGENSLPDAVDVVFMASIRRCIHVSD